MLQNILLIFYLRQILSKLMVHIPYKLTMVQNRYCQNLSSHYQRIMVHIPYKLTMVQNRYCQNLSSHYQRITLSQNIKNNLSTLISNRFLTSQYLFILYNGSFYNGQIYVGIKYSIFEGSDPMCHVTELLQVLHTELDEFPQYFAHIFRWWS